MDETNWVIVLPSREALTEDQGRRLGGHRAGNYVLRGHIHLIDGSRYMGMVTDLIEGVLSVARYFSIDVIYTLRNANIDP